jgi:hypothetical protein
MLWSFKWYIPVKFSNQNFVHISHLPSMLHDPSISSSLT